jgi:predicted AlkP superfamily phosphohydrolase/phosphomutase
MTQKTIVFGLDGACFDLIGEWLADGSLPTLDGLTQRGVETDLSSCTPATTPPAWSSLTTGVNPGKHGVYGFYNRRPESYGITPVSDQDVRARRLWDYTTAEDRTSLVVNVPVTHPGREIDGAIVPGYLATDAPETYPEDLLSEIGMEEYRVYAESEADDVPKEVLLDEWLALTDTRRDLSLRLMEEYDWDVLFVEFQKTDGAVHKFDDRAKIKRIFERVDSCMAEIIDATPAEPNVFVVSDHGIGQQKEWAVALNTWLVEHGYATTTVGSEDKTSWRASADTDTSQSQSLSSRVLGLLSSVGITKQQLERALVTVGLYDLATRLAPGDIGGSVAEEIIDNAHSDAFYQGIGFSGVDVGLIINSAAYYEEGAVSSSEYEALRQELMDRLAELTGPDGEHAFETVRPREAVYDGPYVTEAPDIVLQQSDAYVIGSSKPRGKTFIPAEDGRIDHTDTGLLIAAGPDIDDDWDPATQPTIMDITPTLLHLLDIPLNERFDGRPLEIFEVDRQPEWQAYEGPPPGSGAEFTAAEEEALEERLKGMGYLE